LRKAIEVANDTDAAIDLTIAFGPFRFFPRRQMLLEGDRRLRLGSRALEILAVLLERPGALITKDDLVARVWPNTFVEDGNLRVHIAALRRALGDGHGGNRYVTTIPGRGYRFVAPVAASEPSNPSPRLAAAEHAASNLPVPLARMVGRSEIVAAIVAQMAERRLITIAGPGGIGKTTVALAVADQLSGTYRDGARFVDLAPISDPGLVISALTSVLGGTPHAGHPLIGVLRDKEMLLLFDNCEHVIESVAALAEEIYRHAPGVHILATSREPLRVEGERVQRLAPLAAPDASAGLTAKAALAFPAVQLFVDRAAAMSEGFKLDDAAAPLVAEICRRLDGIALAIEFAAGSVDTFGLSGLAAGLDDRFRLLTRGRRTALPRHQTLSAMLDWSYEFLPEAERVVLRRLAIFVGSFALGEAQEIAASTEVDIKSIDTIIADLVAKSLLTADIGGSIVRYRLLETIRAYALAKLKASGELAPLARRHAEYYRTALERAAPEWETRSSAELLGGYGPRIDNIRAAIDWAFSSDGDSGLGIALTIGAVPLWRLLSLMDELRARTQRALNSLRPAERSSSREAMQLLAALGAALRYGKDPEHKIEATWSSALSIAQELGDADYQLRALSGLRNVRLSDGNLRATLSIARTFKEVAARAADPTDIVVGDRMISYALHFMGELGEARRLTELVLQRLPPAYRSHIIRFTYDQRVLAYHILAETLWLQGFSDQAVRVAERDIDYARALNHELSLCNALGQCACPIALFVGDLAAAERHIAMLLDHAARHALPLWQATGRCFDGVAHIRRGDLVVGMTTLRSGLAELVETRFTTRYVAFMAELAQAHCARGEILEAHAALDDAIERSRRNEELWYLAELLRLKGEAALRDKASSEAAEGFFRESLAIASRQQALAWQLRTAASLARMYRDRGEMQPASETLAPIYRRFTEGFASVDLVAAKALLDADDEPFVPDT